MDFATIAKGFNVDSYTVKTTDELAIAFQKAIKTAKKGEPSLIDVILPEYKPD
jgi:Thiamine pyrophosphate enzyme, C-terminal TPP binding domain.